MLRGIIINAKDSRSSSTGRCRNPLLLLLPSGGWGNGNADGGNWSSSFGGYENRNVSDCVWGNGNESVNVRVSSCVYEGRGYDYENNSWTGCDI